MKINVNMNEEHLKLHSDLIHRNKLENQAIDAITSEILTRLSISIDALPQKCQNVLQRAAETQAALDSDQLDPIALSLHQSRELSEQLEEEYEILKLKQKNEELQAKIDRNNKFLVEFKKELVSARESLGGQNPNPDNIQDYTRQLKQKLASYEESCEKAKAKFSKLSVPDAILPAALRALSEAHRAVHSEAEAQKLCASDVALARDARRALGRLRK